MVNGPQPAQGNVAPRGRTGVLERLLRARRKGHLGHTLLLMGGGGQGAYDVAVRLAQALLCGAGCWDGYDSGATDEQGGGDRCARCRAVARLSHADLLVIPPLSPDYRRQASEGKASGLDPITAALHDDLYATLETGANWSVTADQARQAIQWVAMTPWEAKGKVVVFPEADAVREDSADILLKTLEEPPEDVTLILVTARPQDLLPTVRSRCHQVRVPPLSEDDVIALLRERGVTDGEARVVAPLAEGDLWRARALLGDGMNRLRRAAARLIGITLDPKRSTAEAMIEARVVLEGASASDVSELVRWIMWYLRDLLVALTQTTPPSEEIRALAAAAEKMGRARLMAWLEEADRAYDMLRRNVTPPAVLAALVAFPRDDRRAALTTTFPPLTGTVVR